MLPKSNPVGKVLAVVVETPTSKLVMAVVPPRSQLSSGTSGVQFPPLEVLRQEQTIQEELQFWLRELIVQNQVIPKQNLKGWPCV